MFTAITRARVKGLNNGLAATKFTQTQQAANPLTILMTDLW